METEPDAFTKIVLRCRGHPNRARSPCAQTTATVFANCLAPLLTKLNPGIKVALRAADAAALTSKDKEHADAAQQARLAEAEVAKSDPARAAAMSKSREESEKRAAVDKQDK